MDRFLCSGSLMPLESRTHRYSQPLMGSNRSFRGLAEIRTYPEIVLRISGGSVRKWHFWGLVVAI